MASWASRAVDYRGTMLQEFDLDPALARKPQLILVDELAHTNAPGSRHPKRWQDVEELLDAGINVYTTVNVLSHDLRSPPAVITGATSSLVEGATTLSRPRVELAQTAYDEAERLNRLLGNLLDMTRLESGAVQVQTEASPRTV